MRLARPLLVVLPAVVASTCGWACSTFTGADAEDGGVVVPGEAGADGSPTNESGADAPVPTCGKCEVGGCGATGCAPYDVATGLHSDVPAWDPTGLGTSEDSGFIAGIDVASVGTIWRVPLPKTPGGAPAAAARIHVARNLSNLALAGSAIYFVSLSPSATDALTSLSKSATLGTKPTFNAFAATFVRTNSAHVVAANPSSVILCTQEMPPAQCRTVSSVVGLSQVGAGNADYCFVGSFAGSTGVHCCDSASSSCTPHLQAVELEPVKAFAVKGGSVYWATAKELKTIETAAGPPPGKAYGIPGVTAIAIDAGDMFYVVTDKLFRCDKSDCAKSSVLVGTAPSAIRFLSIEGSFVYFLYGGGGTTQFARFPR